MLAATLLVHSIYGISAARMPRHFDAAPVRHVPAVSTQEFFHSATLAAWTALSEGAYLRAYPRQPVAYASPATPTTHVVLVIDESIRGDRLSVNGYWRDTTPGLRALQAAGKLRNWGIVPSAASTSAASVAALLTGIPELPDRTRRSSQWPTLFQYAKAMNYVTHLLDGGARWRRFGLHHQADLQHVDSWRTPDTFGNDPDTDLRIAAAARRLIEAPAGQFIVILKRGNHSPSSENVRPGSPRWPRAPGESQDSVEFDDGLTAQIDPFVEELTRGRVPDRTVVLYTADHGQILSDGPIVQAPFVGTTRGLRWESFSVPLLLIAAAPPEVDTGYQASHHNVFATVLDLLRVPSHARFAPYARSLLEARASDRDPRPVFSGEFYGLDQYGVADFDLLLTAGPEGER